MVVYLGNWHAVCCIGCKKTSGFIVHELRIFNGPFCYQLIIYLGTTWNPFKDHGWPCNCSHCVLGGKPLCSQHSGFQHVFIQFIWADLFHWYTERLLIQNINVHYLIYKNSTSIQHGIADKILPKDNTIYTAQKIIIKGTPKKRNIDLDEWNIQAENIYSLDIGMCFEVLKLFHRCCPWIHDIMYSKGSQTF